MKKLTWPSRSGKGETSAWIQDVCLRAGLGLHPAGPGVWILGDEWPGVVVHRDDVFGLDQFDSAQSVIWAHGEVVANGQHRQIDVFLSDQAHVAKQASIASQINFLAIQRGEQESSL